jgi:hypothetical protein
MDRSNLDRQALARELVDDVEQLEHPTVGRLVELEVHRPDHVWGDRTEAAHVDPDAPQGPLALAIGHLQSFLTPQPVDLLVVDPEPGVACRDECSSPPPPRPLDGEGAQERTQLVVRRRRCCESLCGPGLADDGTGPSL